MYSKALPLFVLLLSGIGGSYAQVSRLGHNLHYSAEVNAAVSSGDVAPFYLTANRQGLSSTKTSSGYVRGGLWRPVETDSARRWRIGYGIDLAVPVRYTSPVIVQQLYADIQWQDLQLSIGSKERLPELKNAQLSSGGLTFSGNARPVPQVRLELPAFWCIPGTHDWLAVKGHIAYGCFTDSRWQESHVAAGGQRTSGTLFHSKAGFLRVGNAQKFPLTFVGGIEMYTQFGGKIYNYTGGGSFKLYNGIESFWRAFIPGGSDANEVEFTNCEGNHVGSWHFSLTYHGRDWALRGYAEHVFEDHSQMFLQYGWKDMLWGAEVTLPRNPFVTSLLYEHLRTTDQSGGLYHDATSLLPVQISGTDNYYNHALYGGYQHWGQGLGNALLLSPIYNADNAIKFYHNRIRANHIGLSGQPLPTLSYRALFSHLRSVGSYESPTTDPAFANYFLIEASYAPRCLGGFSVTAALATNGGDLIGHSVGGMITLRKTGRIR